MVNNGGGNGAAAHVTTEGACLRVGREPQGGGVLRGVPGAGRLRRLHAFPRDSGGAFARVTATVANRLPWCEIAPQVA